LRGEWDGHIYAHMKTTIEIDEDKLTRLMILTGLRTRKDVVDWALTEAERIATIDSISKNPWDSAFVREAVDPEYDIIAIRNQPREGFAR